MKSFKETLINQDNYDLSKFNILVKAKEAVINEGTADSYPIDLSNFNTIIKAKKQQEPEQIIAVPVAPVVEVIHGKDGEKGDLGFQGEKGKDGKDGLTPVIKIAEVKVGKEPLVENIGTDTEVLLSIVLPEGIEGKEGKRGLRGEKGRDGLDGKPAENGKSATVKVGKVQMGESAMVLNSGNPLEAVLDFVLPKGADGRDGITPVIKINSVQEGIEASVTNSGTDTELLLDIILPKANDGYTPIKGVDYFDGKDGLHGRDGIDGKDGRDGRDGSDGNSGKDCTVTLGQITEGQRWAVKNVGDEHNIILDFEFPKVENGKDGNHGKDGKDGYTPVKGVDYFDGKNGKDGKFGRDGKDGRDGRDGKDGAVPEHEFNDFGNLRFKNPDGSWGEWLNIYGMIERQFKHRAQRGDMISGGGSNLDFVIGSKTYTNVRYMNIDTDTLLATVGANGVLTIGLNPNYAGLSGLFTYDYFKLQQDNTYNFLLSKPLVVNSETVILNGLVLTKGLDYSVSNNIITIDQRHVMKAYMNVTVKYAYDYGTVPVVPSYSVGYGHIGSDFAVG